MLASTMVYLGLMTALAGLIFVVKPIRLLRIPTRRRGLAMTGAGVVLAAAGFMLPVSEWRIRTAKTRLDEFAPVWQFSEFHALRIAAPPQRVFDAIKSVRADEIFLFRTLTWIRRGGQSLPQGILNAGTREPLIDVALQGGFLRLADVFPEELVVGTVVVAPTGERARLTAQTFQQPLPPGYALATMNFVVTPDGPDASLVSTETRVFANSTSARRRFAAYWRLIYPGSAIIRRMWLRAIERRATQGFE
jgi:hypothetical protein